MRRLVLLAFLLPSAVLLADEDVDPEPASANTDAAILKLSAAADKAEQIGRDKVEAQRKRLVAELTKTHAGLVKRGNDKKAVAVKDRLLLAESLEPGQGLDTKLTVPKVLEKASSDGKYRGLLHVLYMPESKASYTEFRDWGHYTGTSYGKYNNLEQGYWVYAHPRWYIWKEKP